MAEKTRQHAAWAEYLSGLDDAWDVTVYPVVVSHSGLVTGTLAAGLVECGVRAHGVGRVLEAATHCTENMWRTRRKLLDELNGAGPGPG